MRDKSSATENPPIVLHGPPVNADRDLAGLGLATLGVLAFSLTLPATVFALDGLNPYLIGVGRAAVAAIAAVLALLAAHAVRPRRGHPRLDPDGGQLRQTHDEPTRARSPHPAHQEEHRARDQPASDRLRRQARPSPDRQSPSELGLPGRGQWVGLLVVGLGVVFGFPVLSSLALHSGASAGHGAVVVGLLPAATAALAVLRAHERPSGAFWAASGAGAICVTGFALAHDAGRFSAADLLLFGALLAGAVGYAEGGKLAKQMPGWRVISWALVLTAPVSIPLTAVLLVQTHPHWTAKAVIGFGYVSMVSMFLGFFAWYAGLGRAGIARASQTQLAQPLLTLGWSALLLGERLDPTTALAAMAVLTCVAFAQRTRSGGKQKMALPQPRL